jgi:hypothetical protein
MSWCRLDWSCAVQWERGRLRQGVRVYGNAVCANHLMVTRLGNYTVESLLPTVDVLQLARVELKPIAANNNRQMPRRLGE